MAHFAEINEHNVVTRVLVVPDSQEHRGQEFLANDLRLGGTWIKTSFNTYGGQHILGGTPLRKNFGQPGMIYDLELDAFYDPQPYSSWTLNEQTCLWEPPTPMPNQGQWRWDESVLNWVEVQGE